MNAFRDRHPDLRDWRFLTDFPRSGELRLGGESWMFKRHGAGLMFTNSAGMVVDIHRDIVTPQAFDAYRLAQYIESLVPKASASMEETEPQARLDRICKSEITTRLNLMGDFFLR